MSVILEIKEEFIFIADLPPSLSSEIYLLCILYSSLGIAFLGGIIDGILGS